MAGTKGQEESEVRKMPLYILFLTAALLIPSERGDLGKLKPVEALYLGYEGDQIVIRTDTEDEGSGTTLETALADLKATTSGTVYLDTADYLLIGPGAEALIEKLAGQMKESAYLCKTDRKTDITKAPSYLASHPPKNRLKDWKEGEKLEILTMENERFRIE